MSRGCEDGLGICSASWGWSDILVSEWVLVARMASGSVLLVGAGLTSSLTASLLADSLPGLSVPN